MANERKIPIFTQRKDVPFIIECITRLEKLLLIKELSAAQLAELKTSKLELIVRSVPALNEKPSNLRVLIQRLKKEYPNFFQHDTDESSDFKLNPVSASHETTSSNSNSSNCSSSSSLSTSIGHTLWKDGQNNREYEAESLEPEAILSKPMLSTKKEG